MNIEETEKQKLIRVISERNNPYAKECPNRHLWSEGFRSGYNYKVSEKEKNLTDPNLCCICHKNFVDSSAGFDTCDFCLKNI